MTAKTDFTEAEWTTVLEGPPSAGMVVLSASHGGTFKETFAIGKAYAEARTQHGESELLDEIVSAKPKVDRTHYHSMEELRQHELQHVHDAIEVLEAKATEQELSDYRGFVMALAERVAEAHREHGVAVSDDEQAALAEISRSLRE
jgi:hypothetical protein